MAFQRGVAALTRGAYDQAIADFTETLKLTPNRVEAYHNRGEAYRLKGDYEQALADYNRALTINPNYAKAYYARGIVYSNMGEYDKALADFTQAASATMIGPLPTTTKPCCLIRSVRMLT
jgi:tetratricopeptide (TPR) repeat protein